MCRVWFGQFSPASATQLRFALSVNRCHPQFGKLIIIICDPEAAGYIVLLAEHVGTCLMLNKSQRALCVFLHAADILAQKLPSGARPLARPGNKKTLWNGKRYPRTVWSHIHTGYLGYINNSMHPCSFWVQSPHWTQMAKISCVWGFEGIFIVSKVLSNVHFRNFGLHLDPFFAYGENKWDLWQSLCSCGKDLW